MDSPVLAALLRAVNVGGRNRLAMRDLLSVVAALGHRDARTIVQSGNVVFRSAGADADSAADDLEARLLAELGLETTVVARNRSQLEEIVQHNPFATEAADGTKVHVIFLDRAPAPEAAGSIDPDRSPGDRVIVVGREAYLHLPNGAGRTKLTADYLERRLGARGTGRNWNTVVRLLEVATALERPPT